MKEEIVIEINPIDEDTCDEECRFYDNSSYRYPFCLLFEKQLNYLSDKDFDNDTCVRANNCKNCRKH